MHHTTEESDLKGRRGAALLAENLCLLACGADGPRSAPLRDGELVVGRHHSCQLSLPDRSLSRIHARFSRRGSTVLVEDLGSRHGTWLSGKRVERAELEPGGAVRLADVLVALTAAPLAPAPYASLKTSSEPGVLWISPRMRALRERAQRAAQTELPIILLGETGTGKELAAQHIHASSGRKGPLRALNCAAIPGQLVESTLFGHERGAFTGADRARPGAFEEASGGTLFLDEVGELSASAQAALLRVLETRRVTRIGGTREHAPDVRIVAATHRDLRAMAVRGEFRSDLLHRLCVIALELPPLRERREEIAPLTRHFLAHAQGARAIDAEALSRLEEFDWPGNIRELRNVVLGAAAMAVGSCVAEADLPEDVRARTRAPVSGIVARAPGSADAPTLRAELKWLQQARVLQALEQSGGNQRCAAARLGVPLRTFERRVRELRASGLVELTARSAPAAR